MLLRSSHKECNDDVKINEELFLEHKLEVNKFIILSSPLLSSEDVVLSGRIGDPALAFSTYQWSKRLVR